jgi:hypothetical protein
MPPSSPKINTYHCHCTTLLLSTTYTLSTLPHRLSSSLSTPQEIILPLPFSPPSNNITGYTTIHSLAPDKKITIIRKEDGFEKRVLYRCERCRLVVGYEVKSAMLEGEEMDLDGENNGEGEGGYRGKVIYLLPGGLVSSEFMGAMGKDGGRKIREEDVEIGIGKGGVVVFE